MTWPEYEIYIRTSLVELLAAAPDEKAMQEFLEQHPCMLPGAGNIGHGGHHGAWWDAVISQPELKGLGPTRFPDFMYVRRDTSSTQPVCIEIESPGKPWFNQSSLTPTAKLTQALDQLDEWRLWFDKPENHAIFNKMYVPEAYRDRKIEPCFVLIYGRTSEFRAGGRHKDYRRARAKRDKFRKEDQWVLTYDMLAPDWHGETYGTIKGHAGQFKITDIPPTFKTGPYLNLSGSLMDANYDLTQALSRNVLLDENRARYLAERWIHWRDRLQSGAKGFLAMGLE